jgi:hypothetical protein
MLATYAAELACTGSPVTRTCQTLSAGKMVQSLVAVVAPSEGPEEPAGGDADSAPPGDDAEGTTSLGDSVVPVHPENIETSKTTVTATVSRKKRR